MPATRQTKQAGYTLVELLIVISIIAIVLLTGSSAYTKARERQTISGAKETIIAILQNAQKSAFVGEKDCLDTFTGIEVTFSGSTMSTQAKCSGSNGVKVDVPISNITFTGSPPTIIFKPLGQGLSVASANINYRISGIPYRVRVENPGTIRYLGQQ